MASDQYLMRSLFHHFPRYIVECNKDVKPPAYLRRNDKYNLQCIADPERKNKARPLAFHCLREAHWPKKEELELDDSQMKALELALTKELAIIQGPPGTGETQMQKATTILVWSVFFKTKTLQVKSGHLFPLLHTGKTHVGLKIARALLSNENLWSDGLNPSPMLVVCYTNHALDQFLEGKQ